MSDETERDDEILDLWMTWSPEEMKYVCLHGGARAAVEEVRKTRAREPLVQEVIELTRARSAGHRGVTVAAVMAAARKLAGWKP